MQDSELILTHFRLWRIKTNNNNKMEKGQACTKNLLFLEIWMLDDKLGRF